MTRLFGAVIGVIIALACVSAPAWADGTGRRVALIIANADYQHGGPLRNPVNDAQLIAGALKTAGFEVEVVDNAGIGPFRDALRRFSGEAAGADAAVVYYAGHGIEAEGSNWLLPIDVVLQAPGDLDYEAVNLNLVLRATQGAKMRIVVLDACRNNPFASARSWAGETRAFQGGLGEVQADGILVIFSAAPGQIAHDGEGQLYSPFAQAFAARLPEPNMEIHRLDSAIRDDVLQATGGTQRPYSSSSISNESFVFVGNIAANATPQSAGPAPFDPRVADTALWNSVGASNDRAQLQLYLEKFPNGLFADAARLKIASLEHPAAPPARKAK